MKQDDLKIGLLAVIALTLILNTYFIATSGSNDGSYVPGSGNISAAAANNNITPLPGATNTPGTKANPITTPFDPVADAAANVPTAPPTKMNFTNYKHDFGNIKQNTENEYIFKFTNNGDKPLIISDAKGSCGCTVPEYPKQPIAPGAESEIKVVYKPGKQKGPNSKTVTITANTEPAQTVLTISAEVEEVPE